MTPEEQRIALAEHLGFVFRDEGHVYPDEPDWQKYKAVYRGDGFVGLDRPDDYAFCGYHFKDLETIRKVVMELDGADRILFAAKLYDVVVPAADRFDDHFIGWPQAEMMLMATAAQWCEAYLKTVGAWR